MPVKRLARMLRWGFGLGALLLLFVLCLAPREAKALNLCLLNCSCSVSSSPVTFGSYDALSGNTATATGTVQVTCQLLSGGVAQIAAFNIGLSSGQSGSIAQRSMPRIAGGTSKLAYNLYQDAGMATIWGDGTGGSTQQSGTITVLLTNVGVSNNYTIYGKIPASQTVAGGGYSDSITLTLSF